MFHKESRLKKVHCHYYHINRRESTTTTITTTNTTRNPTKSITTKTTTTPTTTQASAAASVKVARQSDGGSGINIYKLKLKMANTLSVMTNVLRNVVSKQRIRYKEKGFNLDLAYITDNIIAMGYPADNIESIYRNRLEDVYKFLEENHHGHYKIYNLCLERSYDINKFHGRVAVYPFEDHNPPTIELIQKFCNDVDTWLKTDNLNVAAVHCKAGKGRTGTMICCYLLYSGQQSTAEDALACYDEKRTKDRKGVTIPSQRRYVQYFAKLIRSNLPYERRTLQFCEIRFTEANLLHSQGTVHCSISVLEDTACSVKVQPLQNLCIDFRKGFTLDIKKPSLTVAGDIKVELTYKTSRKKIFHFWFNTYFVPDAAEIEGDGEDAKLVYTLNKCEIDDAHKDKEHKSFSEDFKVQVVFYADNSYDRDQTSVTSRNRISSNSNHRKSQNARVVMASNSQQQNNYTLPQNNSSGSDLNFICDQKSSSSTSVSSSMCGGGSGSGQSGLGGGMQPLQGSNNQLMTYTKVAIAFNNSNLNSSSSCSRNAAAPPLPVSPPPSYAHFIEMGGGGGVGGGSVDILQQQQQQQQQLMHLQHTTANNKCNNISQHQQQQQQHFIKTSSVTSTPNQKHQYKLATIATSPQQQQQHQQHGYSSGILGGQQLEQQQQQRQQYQQTSAAATINSRDSNSNNNSFPSQMLPLNQSKHPAPQSQQQQNNCSSSNNSSKSSSISSHSSSSANISGGGGGDHKNGGPDHEGDEEKEEDLDEEEDWESENTNSYAIMTTASAPTSTVATTAATGPIEKISAKPLIKTTKILPLPPPPTFVCDAANYVLLPGSVSAKAKADKDTQLHSYISNSNNKKHRATTTTAGAAVDTTTKNKWSQNNHNHQQQHAPISHYAQENNGAISMQQIQEVRLVHSNGGGKGGVGGAGGVLLRRQQSNNMSSVGVGGNGVGSAGIVAINNSNFSSNGPGAGPIKKATMISTKTTTTTTNANNLIKPRPRRETT